MSSLGPWLLEFCVNPHNDKDDDNEEDNVDKDDGERDNDNDGKQQQRCGTKKEKYKRPRNDPKPFSNAPETGPKKSKQCLLWLRRTEGFADLHPKAQ